MPPVDSESIPITEHSGILRDGTTAFWREASASKDNLDAPVLLVVHGAMEHGGLYHKFLLTSAARGFRVIIPDLRGHGRSGGVRVHISEVDDYLADLDELVGWLNLGGQPLIIVGHSMGGLVALRYAQSRDGLAGAVLLSPLLAIAIPVPGWALWLGTRLVNVWPTIRFQGGVRANDLSQDEAYVALRRSDTLIERTVTAGWFFAVNRAMRIARRLAPRPPCLVLQAGADRIVKPEATIRWAQKFPAVDLRVLPGRRHELLHEPDHEETQRVILDWCAARAGAVSSQVSGP